MIPNAHHQRERAPGWTGPGLWSGCGVWLLVLVLMAAAAPAGTVRTQTIPLKSGWNAVFLEVEPTDTVPAKVMAGAPVDIVASFFDPGVAPQFVSNPTANLFREAGWGTWYAATRPDAFLTTLRTLYGQRAYLIHATSNCTLHVTGSVVPPLVRWTPDAYNFVGFSVSESAPPTFDQFFAGSPALHHNKIYRLVNNAWRQVTDPAAETMRSGEAFWILCSGASTYQGPLRVELTASQGLLLGDSGDAVTLRNETSHPVTPTLDHVAAGSNAVPLMIIIQAAGGTLSAIQSVGVSLPAGDWSQAIPPLEAGVAIRIPFRANWESMSQPVCQSLLRISTDMGTETWIPVIGTRNDKEVR